MTNKGNIHLIMRRHAVNRSSVVKFSFHTDMSMKSILTSFVILNDAIFRLKRCDLRRRPKVKKKLK